MKEKFENKSDNSSVKAVFSTDEIKETVLKTNKNLPTEAEYDLTNKKINIDDKNEAVPKEIDAILKGARDKLMVDVLRSDIL